MINYSNFKGKLIRMNKPYPIYNDKDKIIGYTRVGDKAVITYAEIKNKTRNQKIAESGDESCAVFLQTKTNKDVGYFETIIVSGSFAGVDSLALDLSDIMESTFLFNSLDNKLDIITIDNKKISYEYV